MQLACNTLWIGQKLSGILKRRPNLSQICIIAFSKKKVFNRNHFQISDFSSQKHSVLKKKIIT